MKKKAVVVGINYTGTSYELRGCVNDALNVRTYLTNNGFEIRLLLDKDATTGDILFDLDWLVKDAAPGDTLFFHYSGHGSQMPSSIEEDKLDEIICPVDLNWEDKVITDNDLREIFNPVPVGVNVTVVLDCCHSGSGLDQSETAIIDERYLVSAEKSEISKRTIRQRFRPMPSRIKKIIVDNDMTLREWNTSRDINQTALLIAGCKPHQTSADALINGTYQGAATYAMMSVIKHNPNITYLELINQMNGYMSVNGFTQRPQLDGSSRLYNKEFLSNFNEAVESDNESYDNIFIPEMSSIDLELPELAKPTKFALLFIVLVLLLVMLALFG